MEAMTGTAPMSSRSVIATLIYLIFLTVIVPVSAQSTCPMERIVPERLPDLNVPRSGHGIFYANGELTVVGGHTTGFVPTPTAEYYIKGVWHPMTMSYSHDNGFFVILQSNEILIGGGHNEELGIGQTFTLERYNPMTHSFEGSGCLDKRRALASAEQMADGRVIISGNHYAEDAIACYDGKNQFYHVKDVSQGRDNPYILPIATDNALIISGSNLYLNHPDTIWADYLKGDAFRVPLLEEWQLVFTDQPFSSDVCAIGDEQHGEYAYLLTATDKNGQLGIVLMRDTTFSLLPTACPIPMSSPYGPIFYKGPMVVDKPRERGYIVGVDSICRHQFVLAIEFGQEPASMTLYHTDSIEHATVTIPVVTPDGDLILAGGNPENNYKPLSTVWLYHFGTAMQADSGNLSIWLWTVVIVIVFAVLAYLLISLLRKRKDVTTSMPMPSSNNEEMMARIEKLVVHEKIFLNGELKLSDVAARLGTNRSVISNCINSQRGCSFSQYVNSCRVQYAMNMMRRQQDVKISEVWITSGFTNESSFFRTFKAFTGMTPSEWKQKNL